MGKAKKRQSWFDERTKTPLIDDYARQLKSFITTMADGKVEEHEIKAQEARLVELMQEIEPKLDDEMHAKVTQLLCELTAYDIMHLLYQMEQARPKSKFVG